MQDDRWLMVADREEIERRMYDDDEEVEDDIKRYDDIANEDPGQLTEMSQVALMVAGGTLPEFGPDGALRPTRQRGDDDTTTTASPTTSTRSTTTSPRTAPSPRTSSSTGASPRAAGYR